MSTNSSVGVPPSFFIVWMWFRFQVQKTLSLDSAMDWGGWRSFSGAFVARISRGPPSIRTRATEPA
ncbi:MAG: hypothetical protein IPJ34_06430 [Myxococcales bacterium]|nr:hypothetical protein [Myxococcales bacterium]